MSGKKKVYNGWELIRQERLDATVEQRAKRAKQTKAWREFNKAHGICTRCGNEEAMEGMVLCWRCRMDNNQARSGYVEHRRSYAPKGRK